MKKGIYLIVITMAVLLSRCTKDEGCTFTIEEYTQVNNSDVFKLVRTFEAQEKPKDYTEGNTNHIFVQISDCE